MHLPDILTQVWYYLQVPSPSAEDVESAVLQANLLQDQACLREPLNGLLRSFSLSFAPGEIVSLRDNGTSPAGVVLSVEQAFVSYDNFATQTLLKLVDTASLVKEQQLFANSGDVTSWTELTSDFSTIIPQAPRLVQQGSQVYLFPKNAENAEVFFHAYVKPPTLTSTSEDTDNYFLKYAPQWMMWALVNALNQRFQVFVQRQEGTMPPPVAQEQLAWREFLAYDKTRVNQSHYNTY